MCNPNTIAGILIAACVAIAAAIVLYAIVAIAGGAWWTSGGNPGAMIAAGVLLGVAIAIVGAALAEAFKCTAPPCKTFGDRLVGALTGLIVTLAALLAAGILAAFPSIIPGAGTAIGIAFGASAIAAGAVLIYISASVVPALDRCLGTLSTLVMASSSWQELPSELSWFLSVLVPLARWVCDSHSRRTRHCDARRGLSGGTGATRLRGKREGGLQSPPVPLAVGIEWVPRRGLRTSTPCGTRT